MNETNMYQHKACSEPNVLGENYNACTSKVLQEDFIIRLTGMGQKLWFIIT